MRRVLLLTVIVAIATPAAAQMGSRSGMNQQREKTPLDMMYEKERIEQQENERAYNEQMKRMKSHAPTAKADPWAGVRPANEPPATKR